MSGMQFGIFTVGDLTEDPTTGRTISEHERIKATGRHAALGDQPFLGSQSLGDAASCGDQPIEDALQLLQREAHGARLSLC